jgi:hypothetical protein
MKVMNRDQVITVEDKIPFTEEPNEPTVFIKSGKGMYKINFCPVCGKEIELTN